MNARITLSTLLMIALPTVALSGVRPWVSGSIGPSSYLMTALNHDIGTANAELAGSGLHMDQITTGLGLGAALGFDLGNGLAVGLGYDRLAAATDMSDPSGKLEYDVPANLVRAFGRYTVPVSDRSRAFLELSVGRVWTAGEITLSGPGYGSESVDLEGSGLAYEGGLGGEFWATPWLAFTAHVGGRQAKSSNVTIGNIAAHTVTGDDLTIDHGGAFARAGFTLALVR